MSHIRLFLNEFEVWAILGWIQNVDSETVKQRLYFD